MSDLKRVRVWSATLRAVHWVMASVVVLLLATGWLMARGRAPDQPLWLFAHDVHVPAGEVLLIALVVRVGLLLLGRASDGWRDLIPGRAQIAGIKGMLRFYLSGGRASLPGYYGHNPFWGPLYLVILVVLLIQSLAGLWLETGALRTLGDLSYAGVIGLHGTGSSVILAASVAHVLAVVLHDWRGRRWEISAMINGEKVFEIERPRPPSGSGAGSRPSFRVEDIRHWTPPGDQD